MEPESKELSSAVTVWASWPSLCHLTAWPALTVMSAGSYPFGWLGSGASTTLTVAGGAAFAPAACAGDRTPCTKPKLAITAATASTAIIVRVSFRTALLPSKVFQFENWPDKPDTGVDTPPSALPVPYGPPLGSSHVSSSAPTGATSAG